MNLLRAGEVDDDSATAVDTHIPEVSDRLFER